MNQSTTMSVPELFSFPVGEKLREKMNVCNRFDGIKVPVNERLSVSGDAVGLSVSDARKILRFSQLQKVRSALKMIPVNSISYSEFVAVCVDSCNDDEQGVEFSKMLDHAGDVIVLGNVVFIRPDQV